MKCFLTSPKQLSVYGAAAVLFFQMACSSPKIAQVSASDSPQQQPVTQAMLPSDAFSNADELTATADQLSDQPAAAATQNRVTSVPASAYATAQQMQLEQNKMASAVKATKKVKSPLVKMALKAAVKKVEKAQKKFDIRKDKKANALDPTIRTGILIGVLGLALIIIGAIVANGGLLYTLGSIALTVGLVVIILAALDVI
jgi:septum formation inhibitor MinC